MAINKLTITVKLKYPKLFTIMNIIPYLLFGKIFTPRWMFKLC